MDNLTIEVTDGRAVVDQAVEIVERKGVGHPDYICDAALEAVSVALSKEYLDRFGAVLHHNIDKGLLVAGLVEKGFGRGRVTRPMELVVGDRATFEAGGERVDVAGIAGATIRDWFAANLPRVDTASDLVVRSALQPGSVELTDIFERGGGVLAANDTSAAVGYAPATPTERAVFEVERLMNSPVFKRDYPETGEDVKVMGVRTGRDLDLTVACPLFADLVKSEKDYFARKSAASRAVEGYLAEAGLADAFGGVTVNMNTLDVEGEGERGVYLTVLGTSAEDADSGQVGRGNRVNGVISLSRPMGTEAAAGKNPTSHVGKIYSVLSNRMAAEIYERVEGVREVYVWLVSRIGSPVDRPRGVYVRLVTDGKGVPGDAKKTVSSIIEGALAGIVPFTLELARGEHPVC
ncbi:MAG: methionine adenosyltransferase [Thermodesulfobacteriota bacterium]